MRRAYGRSRFTSIVGTISVEVLLREVANRLRRTLLNLGLYLCSRRSVIDDDAELVVVNEKAAGRSLSIGVERNGLDSQVAHMPTDDHANETKETTRHRGEILGADLHTLQTKHGPSSRKGSKSPRKRVSTSRTTTWPSPPRRRRQAARERRNASPSNQRCRSSLRASMPEGLVALPHLGMTNLDEAFTRECLYPRPSASSGVCDIVRIP